MNISSIAEVEVKKGDLAESLRFELSFWETLKHGALWPYMIVSWPIGVPALATIGLDLPPTASSIALAVIGVLAFGVNFIGLMFANDSRLDTDSRRLMPRTVRRRVAAFNKGLWARKQIDAIARKEVTAEIYAADVAQWARRRELQQAEAVACVEAEASRILHKKTRKAFAQVNKSLAQLEPIDPQTRNTKDYASLILANQVGEKLDKK